MEESGSAAEGWFIYNGRIMRTNSAVLLLAAMVALTGCNQTSSAPAKPKDAVEQKLMESAGGGATNCGRLGVQADRELKTASDCAMQAAQAKKPFYVAYDMPGMTVGIAGNAQGQLFTVQAQGQTGAQALASGSCPAQLRVASSGRLTCFAPGDMGSMGNPHGGMNMPPANPHASGEVKK